MWSRCNAIYLFAFDCRPREWHCGLVFRSPGDPCSRSRKLLYFLSIARGRWSSSSSPVVVWFSSCCSLRTSLCIVFTAKLKFRSSWLGFNWSCLLIESCRLLSVQNLLSNRSMGVVFLTSSSLKRYKLLEYTNKMMWSRFNANRTAPMLIERDRDKW